MTKYAIFKKKHKAAKTVAEQKSLLKAYLLGLSSEEFMRFYMETPDVIESITKQLIALEGEKGRQEAQESVSSIIQILEKKKGLVEVAA